MKQQHCCRHSFSVLFVGLPFNLLLLENTLFAESAFQRLLAIQIFGRTPKITRWFRALTLEDVSARFSSKRPNRTPTCGTLLEFVWPSFCGSAEQATLVSTFYSDFHRDENYSCLLLNTVQLLSIGRISPRLSSTLLLPLRLFTSAPVSTHFCPESYVTWNWSRVLFTFETFWWISISYNSNTVWFDQIRVRTLY